MVSENLYAVGHNTGVGGRVAGEETFSWKAAFQEKGKGMYFRAIPARLSAPIQTGLFFPETQLRASASGRFCGAQSEQ